MNKINLILSKTTTPEGLRSFRYKVVSIQVVSIQIKVVSIQIKSRFDTNQKSFPYNLHLPKL